MRLRLASGSLLYPRYVRAGHLEGRVNRRDLFGFWPFEASSGQRSCRGVILEKAGSDPTEFRPAFVAAIFVAQGERDFGSGTHPVKCDAPVGCSDHMVLSNRARSCRTVGGVNAYRGVDDVLEPVGLVSQREYGT